MATMKTRLQVLSKLYITQIRQCFRRERAFLENPTEKVLLIETRYSLKNISSKVKLILDQLEEDMKQRYGQDENQMFLKWTHLRSVTSDVEYLPKFSNLVVLEFDKTTVDEQDMNMCKKLVERLSMGSWKKIIIISHKEQGLKKFFLENIDSKVLCILDAEHEPENIEEKPKRTSELALKRDTLFYVRSDWSRTLYDAARIGNLAKVAFCIEKNAYLDDTGDHLRNTPLHIAAENDHADVVLKLLQHKAKHLKNAKGDTPFYLAVKNGHHKTVLVFLEQGVDVNVKDSSEGTPLHFASEKGHHVVVEILIEYDVDIDAKDASKQTALHRAASNGHDIVVKSLLKYGAKVNNIDQSSYTPLHYAVQNNHWEVVKLLVPENANLECTNDKVTLLDVAKSEKHTAIEEY